MPGFRRLLMRSLKQLKISDMKLKAKYKRNTAPDIYREFTVINIRFTETTQVKALDLVLFNLNIKMIKDKPQ
jgi:hypothetical protein